MRARPTHEPTHEPSVEVPDADEMSPGHAAAMTHREIMVVVGVLMLGMLLAAMVQTSLSTALPTIAGELGGIAQLPWLVTAYLLTAMAATPLFGKASDLYGRKPMLQLAVVVFVSGSVLAGLASDIWVLVVARGIQGVGAGGLMALPMAIVGDLVPPRQRGRYQGYFAAVFGLASIIGPALAGFLVQVLTWRWIFWVNIPFGILTFVVVTRALKVPHRRREHRLDYLGAALLVSGVSGLLLVLVWGGRQYAWTSPTIVGTGVLGVLLLAAFLRQESRVTEPILPLRLLRNRVFTVSSAMGFLLGFTFFGAVVYLPVYLQIVKRLSPTASGMMMLPLMAGFLTTSVGTGRLVSRLGRYKAVIVTGTVLLAVGLGLLSTLAAGTSHVAAGASMAVVGLGLGCVMPTLVLAVQNAVPQDDLGVATSSTSFFRTMGGALGTAVLGAVLTARLDTLLPRLLPSQANVAPSDVTGSPATILALPADVQAAVVEAFTRSLHLTFLVALPVAALAFVLALRLEEKPLRDEVTVDAEAERALVGE